MSQPNYTREYTVQLDDQLMAIAYEQGVDYFDLLTLNPQCHLNPDLIYPGDIILLPHVPEEQVEEKEPLALVELQRPVNEEGCIEGKPACHVAPIGDILFFTEDDDTYYTLDENACTELEKEIAYVDSLMQDYRDIVETAEPSSTATKQDLIEHAKKKEAWVKKADEAGVLKANTIPVPEEKKLTTQAFIEARIKELGTQRALINDYTPYFSQTSDDALKRKKLEQIDQELKSWNDKLTKEPAFQKSNVKPVDQSTMAGTQYDRAQRTITHYGVVEALIVSQNRLIYVRREYVIRETRGFWRRRTMSSKLKDAFVARDPQAFAAAVLEDVTRGISDNRKQSVIGKIELKLKEWPLLDYSFFDKWTQSKTWVDGDGNTRFAASAEAQLLRFSAQASTKADINLSEGQIDLNMAVQADFALAEGKVEANTYLPYEQGYPIGISYRDANAQLAKVPLGCFRLKAGFSLNCFIGANATASAGASILLSPRIDLEVDEKRGSVGLKGDAFAGAQAGGDLFGALEWQDPKNLGKENFTELAKVGAGAALSLGVGAGFDFEIRLVGGEFRFVCSGRLVFGPGASGSFGTEVDVSKLWELAKVIFYALEVADNRKLDNINEDAFEYFYRAAYMAFALPRIVLQSAMIEGGKAIDEWWDVRKNDWMNKKYKLEEAKQMSSSILDQKTISGIPMSQLPVETVAIMLDTLVTTFIFSFDADDHKAQEQQEKAIMLLLTTGIKSWRKFEEVLARMNPEAKKDVGDKALFDNMARLNALLDGEQQESFNNWVYSLSYTIPSQSMPVQKAFNTVSLSNKQKIQKHQLIKAQVMKLHNYNPSDELYV